MELQTDNIHGRVGIVLEAQKHAVIASVIPTEENYKNLIQDPQMCFLEQDKDICIIRERQWNNPTIPTNRMLKDPVTKKSFDLLRGNAIIFSRFEDMVGDLTEEQQEKYLELYRNPEYLVQDMVSDKIFSLTKEQYDHFMSTLVQDRTDSRDRER